VVGVNPPGFFGTDRGLAGEFWAPMAMRRHLWPDLTRQDERSRTHHFMEITVRLKPGVTREQAVAALNVAAARAVPEADKKRPRPATTLGAVGHFPDVGPILAILMTALSVVVGLVLLIACANVANLLLARAATRTRETQIRFALGAGRMRLIRQLLTESVLLSACGALVGFALALPGTAALARFQPPVPIPMRFDFSPDSRVLFYTAGVTVLTGILFGLAPAIIGTRSTLGSRSTRRGRLTTVLVGVQVTLSVVLLIVSGLFLRSLQHASSINLGMRPEGVLMFALDAKSQGYTVDKARQFFGDLERRLSALPGVQSASYAHIAPLSMASAQQSYREAGNAQGTETSTNEFMVGARYFDTMGIPLIRGRDFSERDLKVSAAVVNEAMAKRLFGDENPVGRRIMPSSDPKKVYEVVGVAGNSKATTLGEEERACLFAYLPSDFSQAISLLGVTVVVRTAGDPSAMIGPVRSQVEALDPDMAVFNVETMTHHVDKALMLPRICAALFGVFGAIGLALAVVGLYGVVNYSVRTRTKEIGIRMALGARASEVAVMVARQGLLVVAIGIAAGFAIAISVTRFLASLLYGVAPRDVFTFIAVPTALVIVALVAVFVPALRAARLEPMSALRYE
jgi:predicted permease